MSKKSLRLIQISDTHIFSNSDQKLLGVNTFNSFNKVLELIKNFLTENEKEMIVITGDLSQDGDPQSYQAILESMKQFSCPIAWIPGNHDIAESIQNTLNYTYFNDKKHFVENSWQIIMLDSHQDNVVAGFLNPEQLNFLEQTLKTHPEMAVILLHHHVLTLNTVWLDNYNLQNSEDFLKIVNRFPQVKIIVCGHVHHASDNIYGNLRYLSCPSTCFQFKADQSNFGLANEMPGLRIIDLYENGHVETSVHRIPYDAQYLPDMKSIGY